MRALVQYREVIFQTSTAAIKRTTRRIIVPRSSSRLQRGKVGQGRKAWSPIQESISHNILFLCGRALRSLLSGLYGQIGQRRPTASVSRNYAEKRLRGSAGRWRRSHSQVEGAKKWIRHLPSASLALRGPRSREVDFTFSRCRGNEWRVRDGRKKQLLALRQTFNAIQSKSVFDVNKNKYFHVENTGRLPNYFSQSQEGSTYSKCLQKCNGGSFKGCL